MCENFKQSILETINKRIKDDTYELDILKSNYGIRVLPCMHANNELNMKCKKRYIFYNDSIIKGRQCLTCGDCYCEECYSIKMVNCVVQGLICFKCWCGPDSDKGLIKCTVCKSNVYSNSLITTCGVCLKCQILIPLK